MKYSTLGITLTRKCTAACATCCFSCNPSCKEKLEEQTLIKFLKSAEDVNDIKNIAFTGGEPFFYYDYLLRLVKLSKSIGKTSTVITNCYWAESEQRTIEY